jgi:hypothetical protein
MDVERLGRLDNNEWMLWVIPSTFEPIVNDRLFLEYYFTTISCSFYIRYDIFRATSQERISHFSLQKNAHETRNDGNDFELSSP